jgi:DNA replication protein DnaC
MDNDFQKVANRILAKAKIQKPIGANLTDDQLHQAIKTLGINVNLKTAKAYAGDILAAAEQKKECVICEKSGEESTNCCQIDVVDEHGEYRFRRRLCSRARAYLQAQKIAKMFSGTRIGKRFRNRRFDTFEVTAKNKAAYETCHKFCDEYTAESKGLRLTGGNGIGKTHLAAAVIAELLKKNVVGVFVVVPDLLRAIRQSFDTGNKDNKELQQLFDIVKKAELLVLDDLGAENTNPWVREQLFILINARYENMLPTIITTNCNMSEIADKDKLGARIASRLVEMTRPVLIAETDYRLKGAVS